MTLYRLALFLHILGALGIFTTLGLEWMSLFNLPALGAANGRRIVAIEETLASEKGALSPAILQQLHAPEFWTSLRLRTAVLIGIVFLMAIKPGLVGALLTIGIALSPGVIIDKLPRPKTMAEKIAGN